MVDKTILEFAKSFEITSKTLQMYSETHPRTQRAVQDTLEFIEKLLENKETVTISVSGGNLLIRGELVDQGGPVLARLCKDLTERDIFSLSITRAVTAEDLTILFRQLQLKPQRVRELGGFETMMSGNGVQSILINKVKYGIIDDSTFDPKMVSDPDHDAEKTPVEVPPPPSLADELFKTESWSAEQISKVPRGFAELLQEGKLPEADQLSKRLFSLLASGSPEQKRATIESLPESIRILTKNEKWKSVDFSLSFLLSACYKKETSTEVLRAYIPLLLSMFMKKYDEKNWSACQDLVATIKAQTERHDIVKQEFIDTWIKIAVAFIEHLREGSPGIETVVDGFRIAGVSGISYLIEMLADEEDQKVRSRLIGFIVSFRTDLLMAEIEQRITDPRWFVVRNMVTIVSKVQSNELPEFLRHAATHPDPRVPKELVKILYKGTAKSQLPFILMLMEHPDRNIRIQAVHLVTMQANPGAIPALVRLLEQGAAAETDLRTACLQALLKLRSMDAIIPAANILDRKPSSKVEVPERNAAVRLLGELAREQTRTVLEKTAQNDPHPETRALAASYL